jgi:hypothetical protein
VFTEECDFPGEGLPTFQKLIDGFFIASVPVPGPLVRDEVEIGLETVKHELNLEAVVEAPEVGHAAFVPYGGLTVKGYLKVGEYPVFLRAWTMDAPQRIGVG